MIVVDTYPIYAQRKSNRSQLYLSVLLAALDFPLWPHSNSVADYHGQFERVIPGPLRHTHR